MPLVRRGSPFLCCFVSGERRLGCEDEVVEPSFGETFSDILDGFPVLAADDSMRYYFHPSNRVDMCLPVSIRRGFVFLGGCSSGGRRRRCYEEVFLAGSSDISVGFPVFAGDGGERNWFPGGVRWMEAARPPWNKILLAFIHLAITYSGGGDRPARL
jgi:hypothetical protein